jgi:hypothetical protein
LQEQVRALSRGTRAYYDDSSNKQPESYWSPIVLFTFVIAVFTVVYSIVSVIQLFFAERAYVRADIGGFSLSEYPGATIQILNFGQNPAFSATDWMRIDIFKTPFPSGKDLPVQLGIPPATTLWPKEDGMILQVLMTRKLTPAERSLILAGKEELYFWGSIKYETLWIPRNTNFCFHTTGEGSSIAAPQPAGTAGQPIAIRQCEEHNDAD